jgi:hypothetical protein
VSHNHTGSGILQMEKKSQGPYLGEKKVSIGLQQYFEIYKMTFCIYYVSKLVKSGAKFTRFIQV